MAGNNWNVTGDNLPKDSGNRYMAAWYDPVNNAFSLPLGYPVSGSAGGLAIGHLPNNIIDVMTATATLSSGVDLGGYTLRGLIQPLMGSGANLVFQVSGSALAWTTLASTAGVAFSATALQTGSYAMDQSVLAPLAPYRWVRISATVLQTATRNFTWVVNT